MNLQLERHLCDWLRAERQAPETADAALTRVLVHLPSLAPGPGFAERVLRRAGPLPGAGERRWRRRLQLGSRVAIAASLLAAALSAAFLPAALWPLAGVVGVDGLVQGAGSVLVAVGSRLAQATVLLEALSRLVSAVSESVVTPGLMALLIASLLLSGVALRMLHAVMLSDRSPENVHPV